jgi:cell wall-associated NlpC family hydrolase
MNVDPSAFIGKRWAPVGDGPDVFDCWGLTRAASLALFSRALPSLPDNWNPNAATVRAHGWKELDAPVAGAVVALGNYAGAIKHVCLSLGGNAVLDTGRVTGSHLGSLRNLQSSYPVVRFYQWT